MLYIFIISVEVSSCLMTIAAMSLVGNAIDSYADVERILLFAYMTALDCVVSFRFDFINVHV